MNKYYGELKANKIQDAAPFFKKMATEASNDPRDPSGSSVDRIRNAQIVESSKNLLWFVTVDVCGTPGDVNVMTLDDFAISIPAGDLTQYERQYFQYFIYENAGTTLRGKIIVVCAEKTSTFVNSNSKQKDKKGKEFSLNAIMPWNWF